MALRSRTRLQLRRTVVVAAFGALFVPAVADAKTKTPVISKVTPQIAAVGTKLTIQGKNFRRGKAKNSVLFRRDKGKALFVKSDVSTTKKLTVVVPKTLEKYMLTKGSIALPTRFRLRVLAGKLSRAYTPSKISPVIGPERPNAGGNSDRAGVPTAPDGDCDSDGIKNAVELDDDNDLLNDKLELELPYPLDPCSGDTDGDGVEDGFEYQSAIDLNNDRYQSPKAAPPYPYPGETPYPNPRFKDGDSDYDGDGLTLTIEYQLWKYTYEVNHSATRTPLSSLSYSDGKQYSLTGDDANVSMYQPPQKFRKWAAGSAPDYVDGHGYGTVALYPVAFYPAQPVTPRLAEPFPLYDMDRDHVVTTTASGFQKSAEATYWDLDADGLVSDDERDEDADGLTNYDETVGPLTSGWWTGCYTDEGPYPITFAGTKAFDEDSDGDGIRDGADDQDFDDVPNIMERSRNMAGNRPRQAACTESIPAKDPLAGHQTWVQPFNPCLPDWKSRACQRHPTFGAGYPPYQPNWIPGIRN